MKSRFFAFLLPLALALSACGAYTPLHLPQANITTNIPFYSTTVTIVNSTSLSMDIVRDGRLVRKDLGSGQYFTTDIYNLSNSSMQSTFVVIAHQKGTLVGTASRSFYVSGYSRQSEVWRVNRGELYL
ncbi:MAG: hypothetical protein HY456_01815 [Parcubacteria group bacterium]|nr:hypothetical protein [Parcubacteria group bacterium]